MSGFINGLLSSSNWAYHSDHFSNYIGWKTRYFSMFFNVEGSRRLGEDYKLNLQLAGFGSTNEDEILYFFRKDSFVTLELAKYF